VDYDEFIKRKIVIEEESGFIYEGPIHSKLTGQFQFQSDIVRWALRLGKSCVFADTGLGKTFIQLEWARIVSEATGGMVLIVAPLSVTKQTARMANELDFSINQARAMDDLKPGVNITNYDMLHAFDCTVFAGVVLDESSILKNYSGAIKRKILSAFVDTPYKLACTATPSPNDHMEILNHAEFVGAMKSHEALAIWFINDTMNMGTYRLKKYAVSDFWRWVSTWATAISKPSDYGYSDDGFTLPELRIHEHVVDVDLLTGAEETLFRMPEMSATSYHKERKLSAGPRAEQLARVIDSDSQWLIWVDTDYDADAVTEAIPGCAEVRGSDKPEWKEQAAIDFVDGKIRVLVAKPKIYGFGLNFQNCHNVVFFGLSFSFESFYQSVRRVWRYGQKSAVDVHVIIGENERHIVSVVKHKQQLFRDMQDNMNRLMNEFQELSHGKRYKLDYERDEKTGDDWRMIQGDSVEEIKLLPDNSMDLLVFSPPFSNLYIYSDSYRDMGNTTGDSEFMEHYEFMVPDLLRITKPGRLCVIHIKDMVDYMGRDGEAGLRDLPGEITRAMEKHGWKYHSKVTIWKDPVIEMQRTKNHGLLHKIFAGASENCRQGLPDYLVVFRKWTDPMPLKQVQQARVPGDYVGENPPTQFEDNRHYSIQVWQRYASPVWFDIRQTNVLNTQQARIEEDEKHICPLQLDVIERCVDLWTNPGEMVFSPFAGIGSEGHGSLKLGRKFTGIELKREYFNVACRNLAAIEHERKNQMKLEFE